MVEILDLRRFAPIPGRIISERLVGFVGMRMLRAKVPGTSWLPWLLPAGRWFRGC